MALSNRCGACLIVLTVLAGVPRAAWSQQQADPKPGADAVAVSPVEVQVTPQAADEQIADRLRGIYGATPDWIRQTEVDVDQGVVVLRGITQHERHKQWAGEIAQRTQDVVAVINLIDVAQPPVLNFDASLAQLRSIGRQFVQALPLILVGLIGLLITIFVTRFTARVARRHLHRRVHSPLLAQLLGNAVAVPILILGLYVVLRVANLTNLALTVLGGTGLFGLVLGIAFRDIAENYLASILISTRRPFRLRDTIEVAGVVGVVQTVTTRGTLLITFDGNHVLIPNATVYKSVVTNHTANPNVRQSFVVGIGTNESVSEAQRVALDVLRSHEAVLDDPPPMVLVENLGASTVNLRVYAWINGAQHAVIKVRSSMIRLVRRALIEAGISMPAEMREVTFPQGLPAPVEQQHDRPATTPAAPKRPTTPETGASATEAEAGLVSEHHSIQEQARHSDFPDQGEDLLKEGE